MINISYLKRVFSNLSENFHLLGKYNLQENFLSSLSNLTQLRSAIIDLYFKVNQEEKQQYFEELQYLHREKCCDMFPYNQIREISNITVGVDKHYHLPYVLHNGKKLFFPEFWNIKEVSEKYRYYIERENLLGGKYTSKAPHQYQTESFKIECNDIFLDIGCAEGLVALDCIENVSKAYLFEADPIWEKPLKATFAPYKDKVQIIHKWVGNKDDSMSVTLNSSVTEDSKEHFFVKMDIEGAEELVIKGNSEFFKTRKIKAACCTYHKYEHFDCLKNVFESWGYSISSSDGYMLCFMDNVFLPPYFRKGIIRVSNIKNAFNA